MHIFDTNIFVALQYTPVSNFPSLWAELANLVSNNRLISVKEVKREIANGVFKPFILDWTKNNSKMFKTPTMEEQLLVRQILSNRVFQGFVKPNSLLKGSPVADPFLIAAGKVRKGTIVTLETYSENAPKIPTACKEFGVRCIDLNAFYDEVGLNV